MYYSFFSDIVVLLHFIYVIFAVAGGILLIWWPKVIWIHFPAALWDVLLFIRYEVEATKCKNEKKQVCSSFHRLLQRHMQ